MTHHDWLVDELRRISFELRSNQYSSGFRYKGSICEQAAKVIQKQQEELDRDESPPALG
jgi:hypothetical protein